MGIFFTISPFILKAQDCPSFTSNYDAVGVSQYESVFYQIVYNPASSNLELTKMGWALSYTDNNTWYSSYTSVPVHYIECKCGNVTLIGGYASQTPDSFFTYDYPYQGYAEYTITLDHPGCPTIYQTLGVYISE